LKLLEMLEIEKKELEDSVMKWIDLGHANEFYML
jgi:hypothetical protein